MARFLWCALWSALWLFPDLALAQSSAVEKISPALQRAFYTADKTDFIVVMRQQQRPTPPAFLRQKTQKGTYIYEALRQQALHTQPPVWELLRQHGVAANAFYVVNAIAVHQGSLATALAVAALPEVSAVVSDPSIPLHMLQPVAVSGVQARGPEWGIERIRAPEAWQRGYRGQGIVIGGADTGYDWTHPAIQPHYKGVQGDTFDHNYHWHDAIHSRSPLNTDDNNPCGYNAHAPCDDGSHGTHTMGTMTGDDGQGNQIGVAPGAQWIGCRNMERGWGQPSTYIECFEWFLAPTDTAGQNPRPDKAPHVINNSWYCADSEGCTERAIDSLLEIAVTNLKNAGVFVVVSNGNAGADCATTDGPPAYFEQSFSVGATNSEDNIARFSSRGPVTRDRSGRIKPNVAAPGVNVRSCVPNNGYANFQGTSMAGPHVAGLVALVLSARPDLAGEVTLLEDLIEQTAIFYPDTFGCTSDANARPNNVFGFGRVDAIAAIEAALAYVPVTDPVSAGLSVRCLPNPVSEQMRLAWEAQPGRFMVEIFSSAGQLLYRQEEQTTGGIQRVFINARAFPVGVCLWRVSDSTGTGAGRFVVKH